MNDDIRFKITLLYALNQECDITDFEIESPEAFSNEQILGLLEFAVRCVRHKIKVDKAKK